MTFTEAAKIFNDYLLKEYGTTMPDSTLEQWGLPETEAEIYALADEWIREKRSKIEMYHD
jgi:hypothetical protein